MVIETTADVDSIKKVFDRENNPVAPSTEQLQQLLLDAVGNPDGLSAFEYSTSGTDAEALDSYAVPDGVEVLLYAPDSNGGWVYVGDDGTQPVPIKPGGTLTLGVGDTGAIYVQTPTAGDTVGVLYEDG